MLAGPRAREVLRQVTVADLSNDVFPWLAARWIEIGFAKVLALRINYVGEPAWELHLPLECQLPVDQALTAAGAGSGIRDFGMYATDSLRLEKCYRAWKVDLNGRVHPARGVPRPLRRARQAGFHRARRPATASGMLGVAHRLVPLVVETEVEAPFCARRLAGGERVGLVGASAGYGHALQKSIVLAYVASQLATSGTALEVEIFGARRAAVIATEPPDDPDNLRLRG